MCKRWLWFLCSWGTFSVFFLIWSPTWGCLNLHIQVWVLRTEITSTFSNSLLTLLFISVCSFLFCKWQISLVSVFFGFAAISFLSPVMCKSNGLLFLLNVFISKLSNSCAFFCWVREETNFQQSKNKPSAVQEKIEPFLIIAIKSNCCMWVPCQDRKADQWVPEKPLVMCLLDWRCITGEQNSNYTSP